MKTITKFCKQCNQKTIHVEDAVADKESATVWHCMVCGSETRPDRPSDGGGAKVPV